MDLGTLVRDYGFPVAVAIALLWLFISDRKRLLALLDTQGQRISALEGQRVTALEERHQETVELFQRALGLIESSNEIIAENTRALRIITERCRNFRNQTAALDRTNHSEYHPCDAHA